MRKLLQKIRAQRGQSFMEFAISLMFLLVLLSGVVDLGWGYFSMVTLRDSVQEAAAVAAMCPPGSHADAQQIVFDRFYDMVQAPPLSITDPAQIEFEVCTVNPTASPPPYDPDNPCFSLAPQRGLSVRVSARVQHQIVTPFIGVILGGQTYPLYAESSNTILRADCAIAE